MLILLRTTVQCPQKRFGLNRGYDKTRWRGKAGNPLMGSAFLNEPRNGFFWANNNFDRTNYDSADNAIYEDGVAPSSPRAVIPFTGVSTPDYDFRNTTGDRVIPTKRDLEDFARLWVCGITTNLLDKLTTASTITLSWGDEGNPDTNNPTIDLFQAADSDGGIGYLTNETIAAEQVNSSASEYVGRLGPGGSIQLNASYFINYWAGNHFIWCGVSNGIGQLTLTITDDTGSNVLAQASQWIQIKDIKDMYERWTLGDNPNVAPLTNAILATEALPKFTPAFQYTQPTDTNTSYILFVHGWNMSPNDKDVFAETAFKRLYWQGYQGRFGAFRWPTTYHIPTGNTVIDDAALAADYDPGEYNAWRSAIGLMAKLKALNEEYPGHVYVLAHSMGNIVTGEALRLAAQENLGQIANTYVASQAAVPGHCYDSTLSGNALLDFGPLGFYGPTTANIYNNWLATNSMAVGTRINFYNTNDYALSANVWQLDEKLKPDDVVGIHPPYGYRGSPDDDPPLQDGFYGTLGPLQITLYLGDETSISNRYEITAFAAESRSKAMGALNMPALAKSIDLETIWPPDTANPNLPFSEHFYHSAEFRGDNCQMQGYWNELLGSDAFNLK